MERNPERPLRYSLILPDAHPEDDQHDAWRAAFDAAPGGEYFVVPLEEAATPTFAAAANAGVRRARGEIVIVARGVVPASAETVRALLGAFADTGIGVAGATVRTIDGKGEEMGLALWPARLTLQAFSVYRPLRQPDPSTGLANCDAVTTAGLATRRALFLELGGFDETLGDEYHDLDYCLRVRERGLRIVVNPTVAWQRLRSAPSSDVGRRAFALRWRDRFQPTPNLECERIGLVAREEVTRERVRLVWVPLAPVKVVVHGPPPRDAAVFDAALRNSRLAPTEIRWSADPLGDARALTEVRSEGYVAFVRTDTELRPDWLNVLVDALEYAGDCVAVTAGDAAAFDGRCTLVAPRLVPQHIRVRDGLEIEASVGEWIGRAVACGRSVRHAAGAVASLGPVREAPRAVTAVNEPPDFASIVLLNWNTADFTELAVASIHEHTRVPHEVIIIDNGSRAEDVARLQTLSGVRLICNPRNAGFGYASNQGMAAARGTHIVILNNDVIVTAGWLEAMLDVQHRHPAIGLSAPRSNAIVGDQKVEGVPYQSIPALNAFANRWSSEHRGEFTRAERAIGFCMCIDRRVLDEVGGFDPRYGLGNFEDDDLCIRVRAAGYEIAICDDSFVHHFGNASFNANDLDYRTLMLDNFDAFLRRWELKRDTAEVGRFDSLPAIRRGFVRARDYVPLPAPVPIGADWQLGSWR